MGEDLFVTGQVDSEFFFFDSAVNASICNKHREFDFK